MSKSLGDSTCKPLEIIFKSCSEREAFPTVCEKYQSHSCLQKKTVKI